MNKKKILFIGPFPPPTGGDTVSTSRLVSSRYWAEAGADIRAINLYSGGKIKIPGERIYLRDVLRAFRVFFSFLFRLRGREIVLLWITRRSLCTLGLAIILVSSWTGRPVYVKVFGGYLAEVIQGYRPWYRRIILKVLRRARMILPQTRLAARGLVEQSGLPEELVTVFPNFLPDTALSKVREVKRFSGRCVFLGQIKAEKGVFDIAEAIAGRMDLSCDFYGELIQRYRGEFLGRIERAENLDYRGVIDSEKVIDTIKMYDILLLPTRHIGEGMPAVILEAFAAGVPVVATDWMAIPEMVVDEETGLLVKPGSPEAIAAAVGRLASDTALYERIADNAFEYAMKYSERAVVRELLIVKVLGLHPVLRRAT